MGSVTTRQGCQRARAAGSLPPHHDVQGLGCGVRNGGEDGPGWLLATGDAAYTVTARWPRQRERPGRRPRRGRVRGSEGWVWTGMGLSLHRVSFSDSGKQDGLWAVGHAARPPSRVPPPWPPSGPSPVSGLALLPAGPGPGPVGQTPARSPGAGAGPGEAGKGSGPGKARPAERERLVSAGAAGCQVHILSAACTASAFITAELGGFISARAWRHPRARPLPALRWAR